MNPIPLLRNLTDLTQAAGLEASVVFHRPMIREEESR
jgi:hypothetical protein